MRNSFEKEVGKALRKNKAKVKYEPHSLEYTIHGSYLPDYIVTLPSGYSFYVEVKGYFRYEAMRKMDAVLKAHPDIDLRMIFVNKNKKNIRWCEKRNIRWAIGEVPKDWLVDA